MFALEHTTKEISDEEVDKKKKEEQHEVHVEKVHSREVQKMKFHLEMKFEHPISHIPRNVLVLVAQMKVVNSGFSDKETKILCHEIHDRLIVGHKSLTLKGDVCFDKKKKDNKSKVKEFSEMPWSLHMEKLKNDVMSWFTKEGNSILNNLKKNVDKAMDFLKRHKQTRESFEEIMQYIRRASWDTAHVSGHCTVRSVPIKLSLALLDGSRYITIPKDSSTIPIEFAKNIGTLKKKDSLHVVRHKPSEA